MAQPLRHSAQPPPAARKPTAAPAPPKSVDGLETVRDLLERLEKLHRKGGTYHANADLKPYAFLGGQHLAGSQHLQGNLWKFRFSETARNVLDHMMVNHDDRGLVQMTQSSLAVKFGCSQSKVSRAIGQLTKHNFAWKEQRGLYRLNPLYSYRWGSRKQHRLLNQLGEKLAEHEIVVPKMVPPARNEAS